MGKDRVGDGFKESAKTHRVKKNSAKEKAKRAKKVVQDGSQPRNAKAFGVYSGVKAARQQKRTLDRSQRKDHVPIVDRAADLTPAPYVVVVHGPPGVGKTTLIQSLVKSCTKYNLPHTKGPITIVSGKKRRITFFECPNEVGAMIDLAKVADLVLLMIDASFGFEMETFEFLNILQVHGFPKVMGVLTHLDKFKDNKKLRTIKKRLKQRFWQEIYGGAKLFYLSGIRYGRYPKMEIHNLNRFLSVMKFRPLTWRTKHPYIVVDRVEDMTDPQKKHDDPKCDRDMTMYGWIRGSFLKPQSKVHIAGLGDYYIRSVTHLPDPCPLPGTIKKRRLDERDKLIYAPMGDIGDLLFDKDAMYVNIPENKGRFTKGRDSDDEEDNEDEDTEGIRMVRELQDTKKTMDLGFEQSTGVSLFAGGPVMKSDVDTRVRRPAPASGAMEDEGDDESDPSDVSDGEDDEEEERALWGQISGDDLGDNYDQEEEGDEEEEEGDEEEEEGEDEEEEEEEEEGDEEDELAGELNWKQNLGELAASRYRERSGGRRDLYSLVYEADLDEQYEDHGKAKQEDHADWGEFALRKVKKPSFDVKNMVDSSKAARGVATVALGSTDIVDWTDEALHDALREKFVPQGGDFEDLEAKAEEEQGGDFEDLEAKAAGEELDEDAADREIANMLPGLQAGAKVDDAYLKKKLATRASFDAEQDGKKNGEIGEDGEEEDEGKRLEVETWDANQELEGEKSIAYSGLYPGLYARIEFSEVPCEFAEHYDSQMPLVIGGLQPMEEQVGLIQARVKKHRWHKKILKSNDPLVVSLGWRRFQTIPQYCMSDQNDRNRFVKYTPEHSHCLCTFYGPQVPPNTGIMGFQSLSSKKASFRVSATGYTMEVNQSFEVVKKLKLTGIPYKIFKKTAFIKDMFNSQLEVSKFTGAKLRTVSGIRGQIKRALKDDGNFRATFEDKILMSDTVFLRAWVPMECKRFYNPLQSHCLPIDKQEEGLVLMKTANHVRAEQGISIPSNPDSTYTEIERPNRVFSKLKIPTKLQQALPFSAKPKLEKKKRKGDVEKERNILTGRIKVLEPIERKRQTLLQRITTLKNEKDHIKKVSNNKRRTEKAKQQAKIDELKKQKMRATKKREYAEKGKEASRAAKKARFGEE